MQQRTIDAPDAVAALGGYAQAVELTSFRRLVFVSGQIPAAKDSSVPQGFAAQCRQVWANVEAQLRAADMTLGHIVKLNTYLADRRYGAENRAIRREFLGNHLPASTVVITGIFDEAWLLEIEAIAAE